MSKRVLSFACGLCVALCLAAAPIALPVKPVFAQSSEAKPADQPPPAANGKPAKEPQKIDEIAEARQALPGPAGNPECVRLGRQAVNWLWNDDLDTAFRHLDMYDRFGCPSGHIQMAFRCLILHPVDPKDKGGDNLLDRIHACWINPSFQPPAATPAAAVPSPTTTQ